MTIESDVMRHEGNIHTNSLAIETALCAEYQGECMVLNFEIVAAAAAPKWIQLLPPGQIITGRDGRTWVNDRPDIILASFAAEGKDLPIDWEHSSQIKAPKGEQSPAAGWIKKIEAREGGIWGLVEWTGKGAGSVISREYRFISPVFQHEIESKRILRLVSCGLTNQPNLYLSALNQQELPQRHISETRNMLSAQETRICEMMGTNPHEYIEARERDRVEALNRETPLSKEDEMKIYAMCGTTAEEVAKYNS